MIILTTRFINKVEFTDTCWIWKGAVRGSKMKHGVLRRNKIYYAAHRWVYLRTRGPIPDGLVVRHKCDVPVCVNPQHLELGTQKDNIHDMWTRGRAAPYGRRGLSLK
jgi:hypothetical protein